jgi:hypothetical protein
MCEAVWLEAVLVTPQEEQQALKPTSVVIRFDCSRPEGSHFLSENELCGAESVPSVSQTVSAYVIRE